MREDSIATRMGRGPGRPAVPKVAAKCLIQLVISTPKLTMDIFGIGNPGPGCPGCPSGFAWQLVFWAPEVKQPW